MKGMAPRDIKNLLSGKARGEIRFSGGRIIKEHLVPGKGGGLTGNTAPAPPYEASTFEHVEEKE